jgi:hypothetical protein
MRHRHEQATDTSGAVTIRKVNGSHADRLALERLAERDSRKTLAGDILVAEAEGTALAAISLESGEVIADPFSRTAEVRSLLELRAAQLRRRYATPRGRVRHNRRAAGALASSPPGAGGRLISLPRWG